MARDDDSFHVVTINPHSSLSPDYLIAFQCCFILRLFENPPDQRFDFAPTATGEAAVLRLVREGIGRQMPAETAAKFAAQLFNGLMLQIRSVPLGLRVDTSIRAEYPDLIELQDSFARRQLSDNLQALSAETRKVIPSKIFAPSTMLNAAFSAFWARVWAEPQHGLPYRTQGNLSDGLALLEIFDRTPAAASSDTALIDAWAERLGVRRWYEWIPYRLTEAGSGT